MKIQFFTLGGAMDREYLNQDKNALPVGDPYVGKYLSTLNLDLDYKITEIARRKGNDDLSDDDRESLISEINASVTSHLIVTMGIDAISHIKELLSKETPDKTIVLTGSRRLGGLMDTDADFNIAFALAAVQTLPTGVYCCLDGKVTQ